MPQRRIIIEGAHVATVNPSAAEFPAGNVVVEDNLITAVGPGSLPGYDDGVPTERINASGHLLTPGLVNTHHHFYQWLTRGRAQQSTLFEWLTELYPVWARIDQEMVYAAARGSITALLTSGCTTAADHPYVFPRGAGDLLGAEIQAARELGLRFQPARGSMDLGESQGGLPPDFAVETTETALTETERAIDAHHDPAPGAMVRISVAPCSPFTVTEELLRGAAGLARRRGVLMHTHGAETVEEEQFCADKFGVTPTEFLDSRGWTGDDVLARALRAPR